MRRCALYASMFFMLVVFYGCSKPAAEVNGEQISRNIYNAVLQEKMNQHSLQGMEVKESQLKNAVIEQLVGEKLMVQAARENNIEVTDKELNDEYNAIITRVGKEKFEIQLKEKGISGDQYKTRLRERIMVQRYLVSLVPDDSIEEDEMKELYNKNPKMFINPEKIMVRLIQTQTEEQARAIIKDIEGTDSDFDTVADKLKEKGEAIVSDYGWVDAMFFSKEISDAMKNMKVGTYGGPYKGKDGYYMFRVKDREKETFKIFEESKDEIRALLLSQKRQATLAHLVDERKKKAQIKININ